MTDTPVLVGVGVLSIGAVCVGLAAAWFSGRRFAGSTSRGHRPFQGAQDPGTTGHDGAQEPDDELTAPRPHVRDRVIRIVALVFLAAVAVLVALSGWWATVGTHQGTDVAIYLLVAAGTLAVVFLQDMVPRSIPVGIRHWAEAGAALLFVTVLTGLSDGLRSPFFVGCFLIIGAASLSRDGVAPIVLALVAGLAYGAVGLLVGPWSERLEQDLALIGFQLVALVLLAFIGTVAGREQRRAREAALRLARFDPLTGLYNRTHFFAAMERELRLAERASRGFALLMLDLDGLKPVNDTYGHAYGDRLLQGITEVIQRSVRTTDTPARYGGDEFVILLPDTDAAGGYVVAEKLRKDIAALSIRVSDRTIHTSVSVGLVAYPADGATVEELMTAVDAALYEAKRSGKDRIVGYTTRTERVATRMGNEGRDQARDQARDSTRSTRDPGSRASYGAAARSAESGHAPWETGMEPPGASGAPAMDRRTVAMKVEGDPAAAWEHHEPSDTSTS
ncbi:MAG: GGDEF domain-containing protein [Chloroflexi bacterium]|nr:GGDEF domain-containing protein [Chloroflexota bacterium]